MIAFDLDYTLLDSQKRLSEENLSALKNAAENGIYTVPATGRIFGGLPEEIRKLPSLRWCILGNGARIYDAAEKRVVVCEEIPLDDAFEIFDLAESMGLHYDCYAGESGWIEREDFENLESFIADEPTRRLIRSLRKPVSGLRSFIRDNFESVLKIQLYFEDAGLRLKMLEELPVRFPKLAFSSSIPVNIEINSVRANKGAALRTLCALVGLDLNETLAFGDGLNDIEMIRCASIGAAMSNAEAGLKREADIICGSCDESGVGRAINEILFSEKG